MTAPIPHLFGEIAAMLEDLHAIAVEGQSADNAHDMLSVLNAHLCSGLIPLCSTVGAVTTALEAAGR